MRFHDVLAAVILWTRPSVLIRILVCGVRSYRMLPIWEWYPGRRWERMVPLSGAEVCPPRPTQLLAGGNGHHLDGIADNFGFALLALGPLGTVASHLV